MVPSVIVSTELSCAARVSFFNNSTITLIPSPISSYTGRRRGGGGRVLLLLIVVCKTYLIIDLPLLVVLHNIHSEHLLIWSRERERERERRL